MQIVLLQHFTSIEPRFPKPKVAGSNPAGRVHFLSQKVVFYTKYRFIRLMCGSNEHMPIAFIARGFPAGHKRPIPSGNHKASNATQRSVQIDPKLFGFNALRHQHEAIYTADCFFLCEAGVQNETN